ncbi:MAG: hypothetical protein N3D10_02835 [Candidatus Micrarchaeota archaeon]|nr:hypothetical protein [Candidatus Micrarchaeota archaeon]
MAEQKDQMFRDTAIDIEFEKILLHAKQIEKNSYAPDLKIEEEKEQDRPIEELSIPTYEELLIKIKGLTKIEQKELKAADLKTTPQIEKQIQQFTKVQVEQQKEKEGEGEKTKEKTKETTLNPEIEAAYETERLQKQKLKQILERIKKSSAQTEQKIQELQETKKEDVQTQNLTEKKEIKEIEQPPSAPPKDTPPKDIFSKLEQKISQASEKISSEKGKVEIIRIGENIDEKTQKTQTRAVVRGRKKKGDKKEDKKIEKGPQKEQQEKEGQLEEEEPSVPIIRPKKGLTLSSTKKVEQPTLEIKKEDKKNIDYDLAQQKQKDEKAQSTNIKQTKAESEEQPVFINNNLAKKLGLKEQKRKVTVTKLLEEEQEENEETPDELLKSKPLELSKEAEELLEGKKEKTAEKEAPQEVYVAYAKEHIPWLYDIYKIGAITFDEFKEKVKEKMANQENENEPNDKEEKTKINETDSKIKKFKK